MSIAFAIAITSIPQQISKCSGCGVYYDRLGRRKIVTNRRNYCLLCVELGFPKRDATRAYQARKRVAS